MNKTKQYTRNISYGFLAWLIPFVSSLLFYTREGGLIINIFLFKTIMVAVGAISGAVLLVSYFRKIKTKYLIEGIIVGLTWFGINILLDLIVLIPMSGITVANYFMEIGLRYLVIPVMSIMVGMSLADKAE